MIKKVSKTSKKGTLRKAESGYRILGRSEDFYHINKNFVLPVCILCHSKEKSTSKNQALFFHKKIMDYLAGNPIHIGKIDKDHWVINKIKKYGV